jgi:hypothetical protein
MLKRRIEAKMFDKFDQLDAEYLKGSMPTDEYHARTNRIYSWADDQYRIYYDLIDFTLSCCVAFAGAFFITAIIMMH